MFRNVDAASTEEATKRYAAELQVIVEEVGPAAATEETGLDRDVVETVADGDVETVAAMHTSEVAAILALTDGRDADAILADARDELLLAMSSAVTDIERLVAGMNTDLDPKEAQAKIEGRYPMRLREYAALRVELDTRR